jgi:hypothetical protein
MRAEAPPAAEAAPAARAAPPVAAAAAAMPAAPSAAPAPKLPMPAPPTLAPVMIPAMSAGILLTSAKQDDADDQHHAHFLEVDAFAHARVVVIEEGLADADQSTIAMSCAATPSTVL